MKKFLSYLLAALALSSATAFASPVTKSPFEKVIYLSSAVNTTQSSANSGVDYKNPKGFFDGDLWAIPAGTVIEDIFQIVDTQVDGLSVYQLGDDDSASGFVTASLLTAGLQNYTLGQKGAYFRSVLGDLAGSTEKVAKYYSAVGKELKLNVTGTATAGKVRVVVRGYIVGP